MKKILLALAILLISANLVFAAGTATVSATQKITVLGEQPRFVMTISWTDDNAGTTLAINPATYGITGWYLYSAETNPGAGPPTDNYDITLVDADGLDIAAGRLLNRDTITTEEAKYINAFIRGTFTFTIAAGTAGASSGTCILIFVAQ